MNTYTNYTWSVLNKIHSGVSISYIEKQHLKKYYSDWSEKDVPKLQEMKTRGTLPEIGNVILAIYGN